MGRQIAVAMTEVDEQSFLEFLRMTGPFKILMAFSSREQDLWVDDFRNNKPEEASFHIWNVSFPWKPEFERNMDGDFYVINKMSAPLLQYVQHDFARPRAKAGRLYWAKHYFTTRLAYDVNEFGKWYERVVRWVRKNSQRQDSGSFATNFLPDAWERYGRLEAGLEPNSNRDSL